MHRCHCAKLQWAGCSFVAAAFLRFCVLRSVQEKKKTSDWRDVARIHLHPLPSTDTVSNGNHLRQPSQHPCMGNCHTARDQEAFICLTFCKFYFVMPNQKRIFFGKLVFAQPPTQKRTFDVSSSEAAHSIFLQEDGTRGQHSLWKAKRHFGWSNFTECLGLRYFLWYHLSNDFQRWHGTVGSVQESHHTCMYTVWDHIDPLVFANSPKKKS